ncbi:hypothetical protein ACF0H5_019679 [Mactra antiquata]
MEMMRFILLLTIWIAVLPETRSTHICSESYYIKVRYYTYGWWGWEWSKRANYRAEVRYRHTCCTGYGPAYPLCIPICGGGALSGSCSRNEGYYHFTKYDSIYRSGGSCVAPGRCKDCNKGYYNSDDPYSFDAWCRMCKEIINCDQPRCTTGRYTECDKCHQEPFREIIGRNAYTGKPDITRCPETCSWRNGKRCYPGTCNEYMHFSSCTCSDGFTGYDCATAKSDNQPDVYEQTLVLEGLSDNIPDKFIDRSNGQEEKLWTNQLSWKDISVTVKTHYKPSYNAVDLKRDYISNITNETVVGVKDLNVIVIWQSGDNQTDWSDYKLCGFETDCKIENLQKQVRDIPDWYSTYTSLTFTHGDALIFYAESTNGGKVTFINWDEGKSKGFYYLKGATFTRTMELGFDVEPPYHESMRLNVSDMSFISPLTTPDFPTNDELTVQFTVDENGPYGIEITAIDRAENHVTTRRLLIVDDSSIVDLQGQPTNVLQANSKQWINKETGDFEIRWPARFINKRHTSGHWLDAVEGGTSELDDTFDISERNTSAIHNLNGTVRSEVDRTVTLDDSTWDVNNIYVPQHYFDEERMIITDEECIDGKRIVFTVRTYDVMGVYNEDTVTVMIDTSYPIIENLWLTEENYLNISVHNILEINKLTFEWEVYDEHSGLHEISWRIFDNYTNIEILHGHSHEPPQGEAESLDECNTKYKGYARGPNCYKTPYNGYYHRHYQIKPRVTNLTTGGILENGTHGKHESDYYIQVTATNNANLTTTVYHKITIDTSPPHAGIVHDGLLGQSEVDYQQSTTLSAHWNAFFDKESSVWFYLYGFSTRCLNEDDFDIHNVDNILIHKTYETSAEYQVNDVGTYYTTVIAYNHALDGSIPVCSDGVTVDILPPQVTEIVIKDSVIKQGILQDSTSGKIYMLDKHREIKEIFNPTATQINKATTLPTSIINNYPKSRFLNGSEIILHGPKFNDESLTKLSTNPTTLVSFDTHLTLSWNVSDTPSGILDFDVGLATHLSDYPDIMDFRSSHHHKFITILYPNIWDGSLFDILIKATTKSGVTNIKSIGPIQVDLTPPIFQGDVSIKLEADENDDLLLVEWNEDCFIDDIDRNPLTFSLAIGSSQHGTDIKSFSSLTSGGSCITTEPPTCTIVNITTLPWLLHQGEGYYITIKAENTAGLYVLSTSEPYIHYTELTSKGVVYDLDINDENKIKDKYDVDFQIENTSLCVGWSGFIHPHEDITFNVQIYDNLTMNAIYSQTVVNASFVKFTDIELQPYTTYYPTVTAMTRAGNITSMSDGVTVIIENDQLDWLTVYDGPGMYTSNQTAYNVERSHHYEDKRLTWSEDVDYQSSTNKLEAYWSVPVDKMYFVKDVYWAIQEKAPVADYWTMFRDYEHLKTTDSLEANELQLIPGRMYRTLIKYCAGKYCYKPSHSNGVTIIPSPPLTGNLQVEVVDTNLTVYLEAFVDSDIEDIDEQFKVMDNYEWAFTDNINNGRLVTKWKLVDIDDIYNTQLNFTIALNGTITFTKCWRLAVRGYTKAGLSSVVSTEIRNCSNINEVRPSIVIDAYGEAVLSPNSRHEGQGIYLEENALWPLSDVDYTPYNNMLSAVWPTLRHKNYKWAVLTLTVDDPLMFYKSTSDISLSDPCSHPNAMKCGTTENGYINVRFDEGELQHGHRYITCVHAASTQLQHEFWIQDLDEVNECSDGITIDLTPPETAEVWIGNEKGQLFQTSTTDLSVNWNSFSDVEELENSPHSSGIAYYETALGTSYGGTDIVDFINVGLTNHRTFHQLSLKPGYTYFATVKAFDFVQQNSQSISDAIKIDTTPPVLLDGTIKIPSRYITDSYHMSACWNSLFEDKESGIAYYEWCIGTSAGYDDIMKYIKTTEECNQSPDTSLLSLIEGHSYFVSVKAFNNAGLWRTTSSYAFQVDETPPVAGSVFDVNPDSMETGSDIDYTTSTTELTARWTKFHDPHSTITECYISVGTCAKCNNVRGLTPVGLKQNIVLTNLHLVEGVRYYITITAYNAAGMYSSASSDGVLVDTTSPIPGHVIDGIQGTDIQYQSSRRVIGCKWYGFYDPQSTISHYVWRLGTTRGGDDILPSHNVHKALHGLVPDYELLTGHLLPHKRMISCTVRTYNKAGMYIEASSNGLIIDVTPPIFGSPLIQSPIGRAIPGTSVLRSILKVEWQVNDQESYIDDQYLSISSHIGGDFNTSSTWVPGITRDHTFTELELHDGSLYDVKLISCNGAKLCNTSILRNILIDSSPPTTGTFAINTDHAASLDRQPGAWMIWTPISIKLAWLGFQDLHSGIKEYRINIGSYFMGNDLNPESNTPIIIEHDPTCPILEDGMVQTYEIFPKPLSQLKSIFISIAAVNKVGLVSSILHGEFRLEHHGRMSLVRRCDKHTCLGHCVCAPHGEFCEREDAVCKHDITDEYAPIMVQDHINLEFPSNIDSLEYTAINTMLAAQWSITDYTKQYPMWYECSVGESSYNLPTGIFNAATEKIWYEVGTSTNWIFTFTPDKQLLTGVRYSFFVKAWYTPNHYVVYKSPGVIIKPSHPKATNIRGRRLKEVAIGLQKDLDFVSTSEHFEADWKGKFINSDNSIAKYRLFMSTYSGGHDAHVISTDLSPDVTKFNLTGLPYLEHTKYYAVLQAFSFTGLHTTIVSDGFMLDSNPPHPGIVHDGKVMTERLFTSSNTSADLYWHGFSDSDSGVTNYEYCFSTNESVKPCDFVPFQSAGIATKKTVLFPEPVKQGTKLVSSVRAYDAAGLVSDEVKSTGFIIDITPPYRVRNMNCGQNLIKDLHFSENPIAVTTNDALDCNNDVSSEWVLEDESCASVVEIGTNDGNVLILNGVVSQTITDISPNQGYFLLTFYTSAVPHQDLSQSINDGFIDINGEVHSFITYMRTDTDSYVWQKHEYYFDATTDNINIRLGTINKQHVIAMKDIVLQTCEPNCGDGGEYEPSSGHVNAHTVFVHDWSSIHAHWNFVDHESEIVEYYWAIGTVLGGTQLQGFVSVGRRTFASHSSLNLVHDSTVYVTVVAVNAAGLKTVSYSDPVIIDLTPPVFVYIHDGNDYDEDDDYQKSLLIGTNWFVTDPESGIVECSRALGIEPGDDSIQSYLPLNMNTTYAETLLSYNPNLTIYTTIECRNGAGLTSRGHSDGIRILESSPSTKHVVLEVLGHSNTQYPIRGHYHGSPSEVRFRWSGFNVNDGIDSILVSIKGKDIESSELVTNSPVGYTYTSFDGLSLKDGEYTISVTAFNEVNLYSEKVSEVFILLTSPPTLTEQTMNMAWNKQSSTARCAWGGVFSSDHPLYYEITVRLSGASDGDLLQWQETTNSYLDIIIDRTSIPEVGVNVEFSVRAIGPSGLFVIANGKLFIS